MFIFQAHWEVTQSRLPAILNGEFLKEHSQPIYEKMSDHESEHWSEGMGQER